MDKTEASITFEIIGFICIVSGFLFTGISLVKGIGIYICYALTLLVFITFVVSLIRVVKTTDVIRTLNIKYIIIATLSYIGLTIFSIFSSLGGEMPVVVRVFGAVVLYSLLLILTLLFRGKVSLRNKITMGIYIEFLLFLCILFLRLYIK